MAFLSQIGLMFLGVLAVIWLRAVWNAKAADSAWDWEFFLLSNTPRFVLAFIGVLILGTAAYNDAAGVQSTLEKFGAGIQLTAGFASGAVIASFVLIMPASGKALALLVTASLVVGMTGCTANLDKLQRNVDQMRLHNKNIQKVTNDFFAAGRIDRPVLAAVNKAGEGFSRALNTADAAIVAARAIKPDDGKAFKSALDYAERLIDHQVWDSFIALGESIVGEIPQEMKAKIDEYLAGIRLLFTTIRGIFADAQVALAGREHYV